jgi:hypothetical protein
MGDTYAAWICTSLGGTKKHTIVCKAHSVAYGVACRRYGHAAAESLDLVAKFGKGEVVIVEDDGSERTE